MTSEEKAIKLLSAEQLKEQIAALQQKLRAGEATARDGKRLGLLRLALITRQYNVNNR